MCGDDRDLINGRPTGSVRISFGYMSSVADASRCLRFIADCFLDVPAARKPLLAAPDWFKAPLGCSNSDTLSADSFGKRLHGPPGREGWRSGVDSTGGNSAARGEKGGEREDEDESITEVEGGEEERGGEVQCSEKRRKLTDIFLYPVKSCGAFRVCFVCCYCCGGCCGCCCCSLLASSSCSFLFVCLFVCFFSFYLFFFVGVSTG